MNRNRNSSIEMLRIISMLFIILSHFTVHGGLNPLAGALTINRIFYTLTYLGNLGVAVFIAITGWFYDVEFKLQKACIVYFRVFFYSIIIYICFSIIGKVDIDREKFINCINAAYEWNMVVCDFLFCYFTFESKFKVFYQKLRQKNISIYACYNVDSLVNNTKFN